MSNTRTTENDGYRTQAEAIADLKRRGFEFGRDFGIMDLAGGVEILWFDADDSCLSGEEV